MSREPCIPVLTYHSANIEGNSYEENDHVALASDLRSLHSTGVAVVSLGAVLAWHAGADWPSPEGPCVALTFDDGTNFDYYDLDHPRFGLQRSFFNLLVDFRDESGVSAPAAAFVIASPEARSTLDRRGLAGRGWWTDEWWASALASDLLTIECHSWDHLHPDLDHVAQRDDRKGNFEAVASFDDCELQIRQAADYIERASGGRRPSLFAFPWGQYSDYLVREYLPGQRRRHGFRAAFTTDPEPVRRGHSRWTLPRFVCGRDWKSSSELNTLLRACFEA